MKIKTISDIETKNFAEKIARKFKKGGIIALIGDLGVGKTAFAQGFAKGLGIKEKVISPTFVIIRQHQIPLSKKNFYHIDLYRLENNVEINQVGLKDLLEDPNSIVLIEWAEKVISSLPENTLVIRFKKLKEDTREISVSSFET